ncbi:hypothetical protein SMICM17S_12557 [Streptomyces microflavus]
MSLGRCARGLGRCAAAAPRASRVGSCADGSCTQLPVASLRAACGVPARRPAVAGLGTSVRPRTAPPLGAAVLGPGRCSFALSRQSQVLMERFLASTLPAGAISHLNYAQKVAQIPDGRCR